MSNVKREFILRMYLPSGDMGAVTTADAEFLDVEAAREAVKVPMDLGQILGYKIFQKVTMVDETVVEDQYPDAGP